MSVRATLTPVDPVLVKEFWKGEDAFIASSRLPTVKSIVIIIANPSAMWFQHELTIGKEKEADVTSIEKITNHHSPGDYHRCIFDFLS